MQETEEEKIKTKPGGCGCERRYRPALERERAPRLLPIRYRYRCVSPSSS